jgi:hypothetical protein
LVTIFGGDSMNSPMRFAAVLALAAALGFAAATSALAIPRLGYVQTFSGGTLGGFDSQDVRTNPGTGGVGGVGDGYLHISMPALGHLGAVSSDTAYVGDWMGANVNQLKLWLNDTDAPQAIEIHVVIGNENDFWESNVGFTPPANSWAQFTLDLADSTQFTQIITPVPGFAAAMQNVDLLLFRHDKPPIIKSPDLISGDFGIDNIELSNPLLGVPGGQLPGLSPVRLAPPFPNPSRGAIACAFDVADEAPVRVTVLDARGRLVHAETLAGAAAGRRTWTWNGIDDHGRAAAAGVYRVRVVGQGGGMSRPFVLVR